MYGMIGCPATALVRGVWRRGSPGGSDGIPALAAGDAFGKLALELKI